MDINSFAEQAAKDLIQPEKDVPVVVESSDSKSKDAIVNMAIEDLTGEKQVDESKPVDVKAPEHKNVDLEKAFSDSMSGQNESVNENEEVKDTIAQDIALEGKGILEKMLKGLR